MPSELIEAISCEIIRGSVLLTAALRGARALGWKDQKTEKFFYWHMIKYTFKIEEMRNKTLFFFKEQKGQHGSLFYRAHIEIL